MNTSSKVHFNRKDCLRQIFRQARKKVCFYARVELRDANNAAKIINNITHFVRTKDPRFGRSFTKCTAQQTFDVFWEIDLGKENPSMYLHRGGISVAGVGLQAESEELWRDEISTVEGVNFLNAHAMNIRLHMRLSKALKEFSRSNQWKERMKDVKLDSIGLEEICVVHMFFANEMNEKKRELTVRFIPTIKIEDYCKLYAKEYFGDKITHLIAQPNHSSTRIPPSLQWTASYHEQELVTMATFPTKATTESFYAVLLMVTRDEVMRAISRDIVMHVFLETIHHMGRWLEMNFGGGKTIGEHDHDAIMDSFFQNLRQKLECHFVGNHFSPEINLLEVNGLDFNKTVLVINKLKAILRGNCECCRGLLKKSIRTFHNSNKKKRNSTKKNVGSAVWLKDDF